MGCIHNITQWQTITPLVVQYGVAILEFVPQDYVTKGTIFQINVLALKHNAKHLPVTKDGQVSRGKKDGSAMPKSCDLVLQGNRPS